MEAAAGDERSGGLAGCCGGEAPVGGAPGVREIRREELQPSWCAAAERKKQRRGARAGVLQQGQVRPAGTQRASAGKAHRGELIGAGVCARLGEGKVEGGLWLQQEDEKWC